MKYKKMVNVFLIVVFVMIFAVGCGKNKKPSEEQLKADMEIEIIDANSNIKEFEVESESTDEDNAYKAIIAVTYSDEEVEYKEKYHFVYAKYDDEWLLDDIEDYDEDEWTVKPISVPVLEDYKEACLWELSDSYGRDEYDVLEPAEEKTEENLEEGEVVFVYNVENKTPIEYISGDINFYVEFDEDYAEWDVTGLAYGDNYKVEYDVIHSWTGKGSDLTEIVFDEVKEEKNFDFEIISFNQGEADAILVFEGNEYKLKGTITLPEYTGQDVRFDFVNEAERISIDGNIELDGKISASVNTAYKRYDSGTILLNRRKVYAVEMEME